MPPTDSRALDSSPQAQAGHTPGPWQVHHSHGYLVVESDDEELFVKVCKGIGKGKDLANASLIATAPELLEALRVCVDALDRIRIRGGFDTAAEVLARRVIAKVEGHQP